MLQILDSIQTEIDIFVIIITAMTSQIFVRRSLSWTPHHERSPSALLAGHVYTRVSAHGFFREQHELRWCSSSHFPSFFSTPGQSRSRLCNAVTPESARFEQVVYPPSRPRPTTSPRLDLLGQFLASHSALGLGDSSPRIPDVVSLTFSCGSAGSVEGTSRWKMLSRPPSFGPLIRTMRMLSSMNCVV